MIMLKQMMKTCALLSPLAFAGPSLAATLVQFSFDTSHVDGTLVAPTTIHENVAAPAITAGSGLNVSASIYRPVGDSELLLVRATGISEALTAADAVNSNVYWSFTVTPDAGLQLDLDTLSFKFGSFNSNPTMYFFVRTDANGDNFNTDLGVFGPTNAPAGGVGSASIDLTASSMDFTGLSSTTTFRIYAYAETPYVTNTTNFDSGKTGGFGDLTLEGTVVPEPGAVGLLVGAGMLALRRRRH